MHMNYDKQTNLGQIKILQLQQQLYPKDSDLVILEYATTLLLNKNVKEGSNFQESLQDR